MKKNPPNLTRLIDHTLLRADATQSELKKLCDEAIEHSFFAVCVNPRWIPYVSAQLKDSKVLPITVVGFPLGASLSQTKASETAQVVATGAQEIDMVIDLGALKSGQWVEVENDIRSVVKAASGKAVKVILESCLLSDEQIVEACKISVHSGAQFVKTSTGFSTGGATAHHLQLMRKTVGPNFGVKASGGIKTLSLFNEMFEAGANRIGSSASVQILKESQNA